MKVSIETFSITLKRTLHNHCYPRRTTGWVRQYRVPRPYRWRETAERVRKSLPSPSIRSAVASFLVVIVIKPSCPHPGRQFPLDLDQRDGVRSERAAPGRSARVWCMRWVRWVWTVRGETKSCGQPVPDESHHVALGRGERRPPTGGPSAFAAAALRLGDRLLGRQGRARR